MALIYSSTNNFWIKPNALNIGLNHFDNPNLIEVSLLAGAVIMAYKQDVIAFNAAHNYRTWRLNASRTFLEKDDRCYVYARLDRAETSNYAQVIYSYQQFDILGRATEDAAITEYYYILLGVLSPAVDSDGNKVNRTWEEGFYTGSLATDQYIKEESGGDWTKMFRLNGVTDFIEVLKTISSATINALKVVTSFSLAGKTVKGIDDSTSDAASDYHLATSSYVDANALSSKNDDVAQGKITFSQGINMDSVDITDIDTSGESLNTTKDNSLPTSKAVVKYVDNNTLSSKTEDTAQGKITFADGLEIGEYEQLMKGGNIDEDGNAELNSLKLRESLIVPEIKYNRATVFKGIQYLSFGGGVVESVNTENQTMKLKLENGEALGVDAGDLCVGYWHFVDGTNNARANSDNHNGYFNIAGFCTIYFRVDLIDSDNTIHYSLRSGYSVHPVAGLNFACIANNNYSTHKPDRHACKITTTDYEIRLQKLYDWTYTPDNIYRIEGKLNGFSMTAVNDGITYKQDFEGHGVVFGNAYMYGTLQQFDREVWRMVLSYENDNILSGDKKLTATVYRNDVEVSYGTSAGQVTSWELYRNGNFYDSIGTDGTITLSEADIPNGSDNVTFEVVATVISTGVNEETNNNEIVVSQTVTFHRLKQGEKGEKGDKGDKGDTGANGTNGKDGEDGTNGKDGTDGKDAVQPNYMDGTSVDGTVERNEWKVNTYNNSSNPYRVNTNPQFEDLPHLTLNPSVFGKKCRFTFDIKGSFATVLKGAYYVLQTAFSLPWVKGIVQPTENLNKLYGYAEFTIGGIVYKSSLIDSGYLYSEGVTVTNVSVQVARNSTTAVPTSGYSSSVSLTTTYKYLFVRLSITKSNGSVQYSDSVLIENFTATSSVTVYASNATVYTNVEGENNNPPMVGVTLETSKWLCKKNYSAQSNLVINESANTTFTFPTNTTDFKAYLRIYGMYNSTNSYTIYKNIKAELYDEKSKENTAYIPSENDKARATNVNLLDGTRNGKNSEGKEIWTKTTNNRGTITFGDNLFTLTSSQAGNGGNAMYITSPTINLLEGNYTLSFDMKMVNCYGARLVINGTSHSTIASTTDWTTHRILLPKYSGEKTFRFDSFLSVAEGTTSNLYIRNIKLEEGCFGTAWTISENDKGGKPGFTYRPCGTYDSTVLYTSNSEIKDVVYYNNNYYVCVNQPPSSGYAPTNTTYWEASSKLKFLSVDALFADEAWVKALSAGTGDFDNLVAKNVKISGELNATKGTFHDVVINGAYNKLFQTVRDLNVSDFVYYNSNDGNYYPLLHSWGDVISINYPYITPLVLPSLLPYSDSEGIKFYPVTGYKRNSAGNIGTMTLNDIRSLVGRQFVIYLPSDYREIRFKTNVYYRNTAATTQTYNFMMPYITNVNFWNALNYHDGGTVEDVGFSLTGGMFAVLQLRIGYKRINAQPCEMLYWEVYLINTINQIGTE